MSSVCLVFRGPTGASVTHAPLGGFLAVACGCVWRPTPKHVLHRYMRSGMNFLHVLSVFERETEENRTRETYKNQLHMCLCGYVRFKIVPHCEVSICACLIHMYPMYIYIVCTYIYHA